MEKEINELIAKYEEGNMSLVTLKAELLRLFSAVGRSEQCAHEFKVDDKSEIPFDLICQKCGKKS